VFISRSTTGCDDNVESGVRLLATRGAASDSLTIYSTLREVGLRQQITIAGLRNSR
jgi:hypothetical protein